MEFVLFIRVRHPKTPILLVETATTVKSAIVSDNLIGTDQEGTVDGVHYTDLGFLRYAENIVRVIR